MRPRACPLALAIVLLLATSLGRAAEQISIVEVRAIAQAKLPRAAAATHDLMLYVYAFRGTSWFPADIADAVAESARFLTQCGVEVSAAEVRVLEAPRRFHDYSTPVSKELLRAIDVRKPAIFFVEDTRSRPAYDAEAIGLANARGREELANTIWVAHGARYLPQALAHELVHVLSDSGEHSNEPGNLMRDETAPGTTRLSETQCQRVRTRGEANAILRRR